MYPTLVVLLMGTLSSHTDVLCYETLVLTAEVVQDYEYTGTPASDRCTCVCLFLQ